MVSSWELASLSSLCCPWIMLSVDTETEKHSETSYGEKCLSMGSTRRPGIVTQVFEDLAVFITTSVSCLRKGSDCVVCTFVNTGRGCQNSPCSAACTAPGALTAGLTVLAP